MAGRRESDAALATWKRGTRSCRTIAHIRSRPPRSVGSIRRTPSISGSIPRTATRSPKDAGRLGLTTGAFSETGGGRRRPAGRRRRCLHPLYAPFRTARAMGHRSRMGWYKGRLYCRRSPAEESGRRSGLTGGAVLVCSATKVKGLRHFDFPARGRGSRSLDRIESECGRFFDQAGPDAIVEQDRSEERHRIDRAGRDRTVRSRDATMPAAMSICERSAAERWAMELMRPDRGTTRRIARAWCRSCWALSGGIVVMSAGIAEEDRAQRPVQSSNDRPTPRMSDHNRSGCSPEPGDRAGPRRLPPPGVCLHSYHPLYVPSDAPVPARRNRMWLGCFHWAGHRI